jgi:hypothetical protein
MTVPDDNTTAISKTRKSEPRLSKDGQWRSFPKVPGLLAYVASGAYSVKVKVNGKQIRRKFMTDFPKTAKHNRSDFVKIEYIAGNRPARRSCMMTITFKLVERCKPSHDEADVPIERHVVDPFEQPTGTRLRIARVIV